MSTTRPICAHNGKTCPRCKPTGNNDVAITYLEAAEAALCDLMNNRHGLPFRERLERTALIDVRAALRELRGMR